MKILAHFHFLLAGLGLVWPVGSGLAQVLESTEYAVKAAYLYNFALYAEWPENDPVTTGDPVLICIAGKDPFGAAITEEFKTKQINNRPVHVLDLKPGQDPRICQVLFINESSERRLMEILARVRGAPVLTVSDNKKFIDTGGMIGFVTVDEYVKFEVNQTAVENADLRLSSRMLQLAYRVINSDDLP